MQAIVMNTNTGAVTEHSYSGAHVSGKYIASGKSLAVLDEDFKDDLGVAIEASITLPKSTMGGRFKKRIAQVYFGLEGTGCCALEVRSPEQAWSYQFPIRRSDMSRCVVGKGFRANYVGLTLKNTEGAWFRLDRMEVELAPSKNRSM